MKKQNDTFLTTYKALEKELTDMGLSIKDYEDSQEKVKSTG